MMGAEKLVSGSPGYFQGNRFNAFSIHVTPYTAFLLEITVTKSFNKLGYLSFHIGLKAMAKASL